MWKFTALKKYNLYSIAVLTTGKEIMDIIKYLIKSLVFRIYGSNAMQYMISFIRLPRDHKKS